MTDLAYDFKLRYDEGCLAAHALNVIGDRWALLVVRELTFAPKRFQMIRRGLPGISAAVLTQRLSSLIRAGVAQQDESLGIYQLTPLGRSLLPVLQSLCYWGHSHPGHDPARFISPSALMISMTAMVHAHKMPRGVRAGFSLGEENFVQCLSGDKLTVAAVNTLEADFTFKGSGNTLAAVFYGKPTLKERIAQGFVDVNGPLDAAQAYIDAFEIRTTP